MHVNDNHLGNYITNDSHPRHDVSSVCGLINEAIAQLLTLMHAIVTL